jgi:hypothetical protein
VFTSAAGLIRAPTPWLQDHDTSSKATTHHATQYLYWLAKYGEVAIECTILLFSGEKFDWQMPPNPHAFRDFSNLEI